MSNTIFYSIFAFFYFIYVGYKNNSFQAIVVSDGHYTFSIFIYGDIQWGTSSTFVGFNLGNHSSFMVPGSRSSAVTNIERESNVGVPGLFVYRVDQNEVIEPGSNNTQGTYCNYT